MLAALCFYDMNVIISASFRRLILVCAIFHSSRTVLYSVWQDHVPLSFTQHNTV